MTTIEKNQDVDWKNLTMPSKWATTFEVIHGRIFRIETEFIADKRGKNFAEQTAKILCELVNEVEDFFKPKPPRTLEDAQHYALTRKFKGTYMALLDEKGNLVKALIVAKGQIIKNIPEFHFEDREISVTMKARYLTIPSLKLEKSIPKRVMKGIPFACDQKKILTYA